MRVRIHPNKHFVDAGEEAPISVKPMPKGRVYNAGTVILSNVTFPIIPSGQKKSQATGVRNVHAWAEGDLDSTEPGQVPLTHPVLKKKMRKLTYHFQVGHFYDKTTKKRVTETPFLYAVGNDFYYLPKD